MAYSALLTAARALDPDALGRYEPFLWGEPTWDKLPDEIGDRFSRTDSVNTAGVYAHTRIPLFLEGSSPELDHFMAETMPENHSVVSKVIRGAGRLSAFLERDPDLKIVHLIRNPLDVVNSGLAHFSFYGGEFHPSDEPRFNMEAAALFGGLHQPTAEDTEAGRTLEWWRLMNEAALRSAHKYPKRIKVVAYERLMSDLPGVMSEIVIFLGGTPDLIASDQLDKKVGPITDHISLRKVDCKKVLPHVETYFSDKRIFDAKRQGVAVSRWKERLIEKYSACKDGEEFVRSISPSLAPTNVRAMATRSRWEAQAAQVAGEAQANLIVKKLTASIEPVKQGVGELSNSAERLSGEVGSLQEKILKLSTTSDDQTGAITTLRDQIHSFEGLLSESDDRSSKQLAAAIAAILEEVAAARKIVEQQELVNVALAERLAEKKKEIEALEKTVSERGKYAGELSWQLKETKERLEAATKNADRDIKTGHHLINRLRERIAALREEHSANSAAFDELRRDRRNLADRLRNAENQLKLSKSELDQNRQQASEMASVLAPRFKNILTLKPLRYVFRQRQRVKAGIVEVDQNGFVRIRGGDT